MSTTPEARHKGPIPPHVRPGASRTHSASSVSSKASSRTHPRSQNDYIAPAGGAAAVIGDGEEFIEAGLETTRLIGDGEYDDEEDDEDEDAEWETAREGSIARRAKWRRPSPAWIYPFMVGATMTVGMTGAPKSELYINLACLVHPPRQPSSVITSFVPPSQIHQQSYQPWIGSADSTVNASLPLPEPPVPSKPLSAADKWFLKLQKDIYDYRHSHDHEALPSPTDTATRSSIPSATASLPSEPLPRPTAPSDDGEQEHHETPDSDRKPPFHAIDPSLCKKDPQVQAVAAKLVMTLTMTVGILSALSAAFWGKTSDRIGRTKIFAICETGLLCSEIIFVLVASFPHLAPGGYRSLLIGSTLEGLLGGFTCLLGTAHAYISDVTPDGSRAAAFSRLVGIVMFGFACGPILGSALIDATEDIMAPFYLNIAIHAVWPILLLFVLPESLSTEARAHLAKKAAITAEENRRKDQLQREWESEEVEADAGASGWSRLSNATGSKTGKKIAGNSKRFFKKIFHFLEPVTMFAPQERSDGRTGKDWNLLLIGVAIFCSYMNYGLLTVKAQYTFYAYGWTTAQLGPYLSLVGFSRGFTLLVLIPVVTRFVKPYFTKSSSTTSDPLAEDTDAVVVDSAANQGASRFDLAIARGSLLIEIIGLTFLSIRIPSFAFVLVTMWMTLGGGSPPALSSLALSMLPNKRESGRLFGAISVVHALGSTLISPLLFGTIFAATVGKYAPAVFILGAGNTTLAVLVLLFVKLEDVSPAEQAERGRVRKAKRTRSSATLGH